MVLTPLTGTQTDPDCKGRYFSQLVRTGRRSVRPCVCMSPTRIVDRRQYNCYPRNAGGWCASGRNAGFMLSHHRHGDIKLLTLQNKSKFKLDKIICVARHINTNFAVTETIGAKFCYSLDTRGIISQICWKKIKFIRYRIWRFAAEWETYNRWH